MSLSPRQVRAKLIAAGVRNLKEFGYPSVTAENILTDSVFSQLFKSMLKDNLGKGYDAEIGGLLAEIISEKELRS